MVAKKTPTQPKPKVSATAKKAPTPSKKRGGSPASPVLASQTQENSALEDWMQEIDSPDHRAVTFEEGSGDVVSLGGGASVAASAVSLASMRVLATELAHAMKGNTTVLEEKTSASERHIRAFVEEAIGSVDAPKVDGELWAALKGARSFAINEAARRVRFASLEAADIVALFVEAGKGVVPPILLGDTKVAQIARQGARILLVEMLAAVYAETVRAEDPREDTARIRNVVLAAARTEGGERVARGLIAAAKAFTHAPQKQAAPKVAVQVKGGKQTCFVCRKTGHMARECPQRK